MPYQEALCENPKGAAVQEIEVSEGLDVVLETVSILGPAPRSRLLPQFAELARSESGLRSSDLLEIEPSVFIPSKEDSEEP